MQTKGTPPKIFVAPSKTPSRARHPCSVSNRTTTPREFPPYAALLMVPTIVGSVYGMNFEVMPELNGSSATRRTLLLMVGSCLLLYWFFKKNKWLLICSYAA